MKKTYFRLKIKTAERIRKKSLCKQVQYMIGLHVNGHEKKMLI